MPKIKEFIKPGLRRLPLMLGKTAGGLMAAVGLPGAVYILAGRPAQKIDNASPFYFFLIGISGTAAFVLCSRALVRIAKKSAGPSPKERARESKIAWLILLALAAAFIAAAYIITGRG